ncbi:acyl-CoA carboxylase subunit beta, partial [Bryobacter aggregatus]|uniref:acyl-CoA carboxylase subunit beta n=1 Tax=Bryobacter aggregatus TaxID=360054 RepID=UPI0004E0F455
MPERLREFLTELKILEEKIRLGGGIEKIAKQHAQGKLTARERVARLLDPDSPFFETGLLIAWDRHNGQAPAAGVVTGIGRIEGRNAVVVANDATVKAGAWWPETISKILRAQEIAMREKLPIVYLVDSAGVNLPLQDSIFPGQYGAARIFHYCSQMRRNLQIPQFAAVMGMCIAGGAYLPALSDLIVMVDGTSFMGLGGPNLVKGATGESTSAAELGGAAMHTAVSGVAHYRAANDEACLEILRARFRELPAVQRPHFNSQPPAAPSEGLYDILPDDHRQPYDTTEVLTRIVDAGSLDEFQPDHAPELICARARIHGRPVAILANRRGFLKTASGPRIGGIIYTESARKAAYFVETAQRHKLPLLYLQDVSGFMVGKQAEESGIIRAGAEMVETMSCATVPKIVLTLNHSSGAGYYAMAGQGFDPDFALAWPTARIGVMEGESAVQAIHGPELERLRQAGKAVPPELEAQMAQTRSDYERWLDSRYAAARGHVDAIIDPAATRSTLDYLYEVCQR